VEGILEKHFDAYSQRFYYYDPFNGRSYWEPPEDQEWAEIVDYSGQT